MGAPAQEDWIELDEPRVPPGRGRQLSLIARGFLPIVKWRTKGRAINVFATLGRHKRLFRPWLMFAGRLMPGGKLPRDESELVILRTALNCRARYEWMQHVPLGRQAGLSAEDIERVREGGSAEGWTERRAAILTAVDELHDDRFVSDATWERLSAVMDSTEKLELCMLTGHYEMLAMTLNSAGVQVEPALERDAAARS